MELAFVIQMSVSGTTKTKSLIGVWISREKSAGCFSSSARSRSKAAANDRTPLIDVYFSSSSALVFTLSDFLCPRRARLWHKCVVFLDNFHIFATKKMASMFSAIRSSEMEKSSTATRHQTILSSMTRDGFAKHRHKSVLWIIFHEAWVVESDVTDAQT